MNITKPSEAVEQDSKMVPIWKTVAEILLITALLCGATALIMGSTGCAALQTEQGQENLATSANFAAYAGTIETLKYLPTKRAGFERAVGDLKHLEAGPIDVIALGEIIQRLDVKELKSTEARLVISGVQLAVVTKVKRTSLDKIENLRPIVIAIREGIERGLKDAP